MGLGHDEHALEALTRTLLAELHLQDSMVDGLAGDLPAKHVQLAVGDFEVGGGVFVLSYSERHSTEGYESATV